MLNKEKAFLLPVFFAVVFSCSFEYGNKEEEESSLPDIVMEKVEYVRVRGGDPVVRFRAELAERYEKRQIMNLENLSFEQFEDDWDDINIRGNAGKAEVELESGNVNLSEGVLVLVDSEDVIIETTDLIWQDNDRQLLGPATSAVEIQRSDGTRFSGVGFSADARSRTWTFDSGVSGIFVEEDEESSDEGSEDEIFFNGEFTEE